MNAELQPSFRLSDRARARILALLAERPSAGSVVRLFAERTDAGTIELGLAFDHRRPEDELLVTGGLELVADSSSRATLGSSILDYIESRDEGGFTLLINGDRT